jgi:DNA-binding HxlR family transcriptional regulator
VTTQPVSVERPEVMPPAVAHHEGLTLIKLATWVQANIDAVLAPEGLKSVINELERRGLVGRERDPENKRCYRIWVTPEGSAWLEKAEQAISGVEDELFSPMSASNRRSLLELMNALFCDPAK